MEIRLSIKPSMMIIPSLLGPYHRVNHVWAGHHAIQDMVRTSCHSFCSGICDGIKYSNVQMDDKQTLYVYNSTHYKRGKYKNDQRYEVYVYKFPLTLLQTIGVTHVIQHKNHFELKFKQDDICKN